MTENKAAKHTFAILQFRRKNSGISRLFCILKNYCGEFLFPCALKGISLCLQIYKKNWGGQNFLIKKCYFFNIFFDFIE